MNATTSSTSVADITAVESRSLSIGKWANLFMAFAGVLAAWLSRSDALMVDGLYSGINFLSAIVAARVGLSVNRQPDAKRPFGYEADEAIYVTFRSMILVGILTFAGFNALTKIFHYLSGGDVPALQFGPIQVYVVLMVAICGFLAFTHHRAYLNTGKRSELLVTERRAAIVDGVISAGAGAALLLIPLLAGTPLDGLVPIADAVVVLGMTLLIIAQPIKSFRSALGEIAGESAAEEHVSSVRKAVEKFAATGSFTVVDLAVMKIGRRFSVVGFFKPDRAVTGEDVDAFNVQLHDECTNILGDVRTEVVITNTRRLAAAVS